jgi:8-oxo-dGTP pyrophosphatase MutT (NUDIX family)
VSFRATARVLLFDDADRVLMFLNRGNDHSIPPRWITPGGGVDPGEDFAAAAVRETFEETGLRLDGVPEPFLEEDFDPDQRWHVYDSGRWAWYAVRVAEFEPSREEWTEDEQVDVLEWRWMSADDLANDEFECEPSHLPDLVRANAPLR